MTSLAHQFLDQATELRALAAKTDEISRDSRVNLYAQSAQAALSALATANGVEGILRPGPLYSQWDQLVLFGALPFDHPRMKERLGVLERLQGFVIAGRAQAGDYDVARAEADSGLLLDLVGLNLAIHERRAPLGAIEDKAELRLTDATIVRKVALAAPESTDPGLVLGLHLRSARHAVRALMVEGGLWFVPAEQTLTGQIARLKGQSDLGPALEDIPWGLRRLDELALGGEVPRSATPDEITQAAEDAQAVSDFAREVLAARRDATPTPA